MPLFRSALRVARVRLDAPRFGFKASFPVEIRAVARPRLSWDSTLRGMDPATAASVSRRGAPALATGPLLSVRSGALARDRSPPGVTSSLEAAVLLGFLHLVSTSIG